MATKYLVIQGTANSSEEAITLCGEALHKAGIVGEDFGKACVEREKDYPTGLPTEIPTASHFGWNPGNLIVSFIHRIMMMIG